MKRNTKSIYVSRKATRKEGTRPEDGRRKVRGRGRGKRKRKMDKEKEKGKEEKRGYQVKEISLTQWKNNAKRIKHHIRNGILRQSLNARIIDESTPEPTEKFDDDGARHDKDSR